MRMLLLLLLTGCAVSALPQSDPTKWAAQPFSIVITPIDKVAKVGSEVRLKIKLTNTSHGSIAGGSGFHAESIDTSYEYDCRDSSGLSASKEPPVAGSIHDVPQLKPGETHEETVLLTRACNLTIPGKYRIQLSRSAPGDPQHLLIKSNIVTVTVNP